MPGIMTLALLLFALVVGAAARAADDTSADAQDQAAIEAMRAQQLDLEQPHDVEFAFYFRDKQGARKVMSVLAGEGYSGELRTEGSDAFILFARKTMVVDLARLSRLRAQFAQLAEEAGGSYDGWGLP